MKKIGFLMLYNEIDWAAYAIDQAFMVCDKLIICEGSQFTSFVDIPERSTDGTLDIIADKQKEYPGLIDVMFTTRKHANYRQNQCDNFNKAVMLCSVGDYFLHLDADEFFSDVFIEEINNYTKEGKIDFLDSVSHVFAFSFDWLIHMANEGRTGKHVLYKVFDGFSFAPTHRPLSIGKNRVIKDTKDVFHYTWVKPTTRMEIRLRTSGFVPGMHEWFKKYWNNIELIENKIQPSHLGTTFYLERYKGDHPFILNKHPWRYINDVRRV